MVASLSSGTLFALTPGVWEASATILNDTDTGHLQHAYAVGVGGFFCGVSPVLLTNSTPMLLSLAASVLVALGWMLLFLSAVHTLAWVQWPLAGLFYLFVGVGSYTAIICACTTVSLNAPRGNRGTMIGAVVAAVGVGSLLWAGLDLGAFEKCFPCYLRALAIAAPLFMLVASVFLRRVERHEEDSAAAEALRSSPLQSAEDAFINDDMISQDQETTVPTVSTADGITTLVSDQAPTALLPLEQIAQQNSYLSLRLAMMGFSYACIVSSSALWMSLQFQLATAIRYPLANTGELPIMWTLGVASSTLLTGFFGDLAGSRMARPWWLFIAGIVVLACHLLCAFFPTPYFGAVQILQGAGLGTAFAITLTMCSLEWGLFRLGKTMCLMGLMLASVFLASHVIVSVAIEQPEPTCVGPRCLFGQFVYAAGLAGVGVVASFVASTILQANAMWESSRPSASPEEE